jgi:hypothetical protein
MIKFQIARFSVFAAAITFAVVSLVPGCAEQGTGDQKTGVRVVANEAEQRVDILVDGKPFTSYVYSDTIKMLKKPVIYPIRERMDHPHQIGFWFNYGDVNGLDFWNNSDAIPPERTSEMGTIRHRKVKHVESGVNSGVLEVTMDWLKPDGNPILREDTRFVFHEGRNMRAIDRITKLTTLDEPVSFKDNKEGMIAVRLTRALEHPTDEPIRVTDASGKTTDVPVMDNEGVTGLYQSSTGITGMEVWGTRAPWMMLSGVVQGDSVTLAIFDHPDNVGYPTYWHARGYGLFSANPLGQKIFSKGKEELNFSLETGTSSTFQYRLMILSGDISPVKIEMYYKDYVKGSTK